MRRICHEDEDEESTPVDTLSVKNESYNNNNHGLEYRRNGSIDGVMPVSPAIQAATSPGGIGGNGSVKSQENEGEIVGPVEQFVMRPASQGVIYKCRITRDRKGMVSFQTHSTIDAPEMGCRGDSMER